ncbi:ATP-grasp domain-containing protein [Paenibacillus sp. LMG 31461]|uniref:ATP-grasp domain-containing protein n=1 Tax=Paenibacillus plantarum TaxID=2654975 RepID=A0ABX1XDK6_9BACL|nr:YheC/YheD family protein [Paenibacillus plantarum]NOU66552.1 ATP-grasp domain-containing protein [Paenibacillus plantarum]
MDKRPLIGIMVTTRNSRKRMLALCQRYQNQNLRLFAFTPADIRWKMQRIIGLSLKNGKVTQRLYPFPQVVYNRCFNKVSMTIQRLEKIIGINKCFNTINHFNKWDLYNQLQQSRLSQYVPRTCQYNEVNISELLEINNLVFIKPIYGSKGASVYRIERQENEDIHISLHSLAPRIICRKNESIQEKLDELLENKIFLVQQGIQMSPLDLQHFDIRVLVQKGNVGHWMITNITCRVAYERYFNTSMCERVYEVAAILSRLYSSEKVNEILQSLNEISITAAQEAESLMGTLGELSVDFVLDKQSKLWIIELNGMPQKNIYKDLKGFKLKDLYRRPMEYAYHLTQS